MRRLSTVIGRTHQQVSITDAVAVEHVIAELRPDIVFNCAAYNAVDRAESEPQRAFAVNATGAGIIAMACARHRVRLTHFSTNYVFDGRQERPYHEYDPPAPLSAYGISKLMGERMVLEALPTALVVRSAALFGGRTKRSFPERFLERARQTAAPEVVADQRVNPTYTRDLAAAAIDLSRRAESGTVHLVNAGCCAWDEFAQAVLDEFGGRATVTPTSSAGFGSAARRPLNGCLESERVDPMRPWREALHDYATRVKRA